MPIGFWIIIGGLVLLGVAFLIMAFLLGSGGDN